MHARSKWIVAGSALLLAACPNGKPPSGGALSPPVFVELQTPGPGNGWDSITTLTPAPAVLPTRGRGMRIAVNAPVGSIFAVSVRAGGAAPVVLSELPANGSAAAGAGFFQVMSVDPSGTAPVHRLYVRLPSTVATTTGATIDIVNKSARTDVTDSAPLNVVLTPQMVWTVNVGVTGDGKVTSAPGNITCGLAASGTRLTPCTGSFPVAITTVTLNANSNVGRLVGWTGDCAGNTTNSCTLTFNNASGFRATAHFGSATATLPTCPAPPQIAGMRWVDVPDCATGVIDSHPGISHPAICDSQGYVCCEPRAAGAAPTGSTRCSGQQESPPDCMRTGIRASLRQPGGCYEVD